MLNHKQADGILYSTEKKNYSEFLTFLILEILPFYLGNSEKQGFFELLSQKLQKTGIIFFK